MNTRVIDSIVFSSVAAILPCMDLLVTLILTNCRHWNQPHKYFAVVFFCDNE